MNKLARLLVAVPLIFALVAVVPAQTVADTAAKSDVILDKVREIDLLNHLLPLLLKKAQIEAFLPPIEAARARVKKTKETEYNVLKTFDADLTTLIDNALTKGTVPGLDIVHKLNKQTELMATTRSIIIDENTTEVYDVVVKVLDKGQKTDMANSLNPHDIDPTIKIETMTEESKLKMFIREILLDPRAYEMLIKISKLPQSAN